MKSLRGMFDRHSLIAAAALVSGMVCGTAVLATSSPALTPPLLALGLLSMGLASLGGAALIHRLARRANSLVRAHDGAVEIALRDPLTQLPNRVAFRAHLEGSVRPDDLRAVAVLYADLDHFKEVND